MSDTAAAVVAQVDAAIQLLPRWYLEWDAGTQLGCGYTFEHDLVWSTGTMTATCRECGIDTITPDDVDLTDDVRAQVEAAAYAAGINSTPPRTAPGGSE